MHMNSWFQKLHSTQKTMACHDKYWCHQFKTHKLMVSQKIMDYHENLRHLVAKWYVMSCHHHMENQVVINCNGQQYFQLVNK
jgi:hypothetical protein